MSGRSVVVLSRFPAHLDATRPGKQLHIVADSVSTGLDDLSATLAAIRRSHRIGHADATVDIKRLGALHRLGQDEYAPIDLRADRLADAASDLNAAVAGGDNAARDAAADALCDLLGIVGASPRLVLFATPTTGGGSPDLNAAATRLATGALALANYEGRRESYRALVVAESAIHSRGNGTVPALLESTAAALDMQIDPDATLAFKTQLRPVVAIAQNGTAGSTSYSYIVVARSLSKNVDRSSAVTVTTTGNATLSASDSNVLSWTLPPDARDFLVFRVANGGNATDVGLLTSTALSGTTTTFTDSGLPALSGSVDPEADDRFFHSMDRFWHAAFVRDRASVDGAPDGPAEIVGMEENPVRREFTPDTPRTNAELFHIYRRGFGRSLLQIHVTGTGDRTIGPMLVNRDEGIGIGYAGTVPDTAVLVFDEAGHVTLDAADVTANAFSWKGACFASNDDDPAAPRDFVFDGPGVGVERRAVFAVATPFDALDGSFVFPHAGDPLAVPGVNVGTTRYAFFVQEAHFSGEDASVSPAVPVPVSPRTHVGFVQGSVFAPPPDADQQPAANVALSWLEHEAYALRLILPRRFASFDITGQPTMAELVRRSLERHRPAGVDVRVEYVDDRWILGSSDVTAGNSADPILSLRSGSVLWTSPA